MKVNSRKDDQVRIWQQKVETVDSFTYLGAEMTSDGGGAIDLRKRLGMAYCAFLKLKKMLQANIGRKNKIQLFKTLVLSTLLYGCKTWKLTQGENWTPSNPNASGESSR